MLISSEEKNSENFSKLVEDDNYYLMLWVKIHLTEQYLRRTLPSNTSNYFEQFNMRGC